MRNEELKERGNGFCLCFMLVCFDCAGLRSYVGALLNPYATETRAKAGCRDSLFPYEATR